MKFKPRLIKIGLSPLLIVGDRPTKQRDEDQNYVPFHGTRVGDMIEEAVKDYENVILTYAINYTSTRETKKMLDDRYYEGKEDLEHLINRYKPFRILCLGRQAMDLINDLILFDENVFIYCLPSPDEIFRTRKDTGVYERVLNMLIKGFKRVS